MRHFLALFIVAAAGLLAAGSDARAADPSVRAERDPNEKICETYTPIGTRLGTRKVCGTRAEWAEKRRLDKEAIDRAQVGACMIQTTGRTGKPGC